MKDFAEARVWTSILAASVGVVICVVQQHFRLQLVRPTGLWVMFHHRCGLAMVAAVGWMAVEVGRAVLVFGTDPASRVRWGTRSDKGHTQVSTGLR